MGARPFAVTSVASPKTLIVSSPLVALRMTRSGWPSPMAPPRVPARSTFTLRDVGAAQVVDGDEVGAAEGVEVDQLHAGGVHRDVALGTEEPEAVSVRRQVDLLGALAPLKQHRVGAVLALDGVAAVAWVPDEGVVAGAHQRCVVAAVAVDRVVPVAAERVDALASGERVVPSPPSRVRAIACGESRGRDLSLPPRPLTVSASVGSWC